MISERALAQMAARGDTTWSLVALGDSTPTGLGVGADNSCVQVYADYIEQDVGVGVVVHNWATNSTRTVAEWVEEVRNNDELRRDLRHAAVITIWLGWHDVIPNVGVPRGGPCYRRAREVDVDCLADVTAPMEMAFEDLLSEITSLASPAGTLILIADVGIPLQAETRIQGWEVAKPIVIEDNVWLGGGAIFLPGVKVDRNAVLGAGAVVSQSVRANTAVARNPARVIREIEQW